MAWLNSKIKELKLTLIAAAAITPREAFFSHETRVVPTINGNKIIMGSTLVSNVVYRPKPRMNEIFNSYRNSTRAPKYFVLKTSSFQTQKQVVLRDLPKDKIN